MENRNAYLDQVVASQERLEQDLRSKRSPAPASAAPSPQAPVHQSAAAERAVPAVEIRVTGFGRWKTVLVPPNVFVVHTRRGRSEPLHIGQGVSFRYNPMQDSYLAVPGAMQTILINAFCICRELQGVLVQAYVQWIIADFGTAYRKLDFTDPVDPMHLVNLQLKEQAEAAIKDKVSTMSVHEVLSDKQPIIEELTARLRDVAEGSAEGGGLGLRIVTVQIKEAVVSSPRLWENLQKPFRAEQNRLARLAEVAADTAIAERQLAAERELAELRAASEAHTFEREAAERRHRAELEEDNSRALAAMADETTRHALHLERERHEMQAQIERLRIEREIATKRLELEGRLALAELEANSTHGRTLLEIERDRLRAEIDNAQSPAMIQAKLIDSLPDIVAKLPKPDELRSVTIGGSDSTTVAGLLAELAAVVGALRAVVPPNP